MNGGTPPLYVDRARRFPLSLPVRYRRPGDLAWMDGVTIDASRTGVLFAADAPVLRSGEEVEFRIRLPAIRGPCGSEVRCIGRVQRVVPGQSEGARVAVAVAIDRYRLVPASEVQQEVESIGNSPVRVGHEGEMT